MNILKRSLFTLMVLLIFSSCSNVYFSQDAKKLAEKQKTIAIIPPVVSASKPYTDPQSLYEQQRTESLTYQKEIYSWLLKRKAQGKFAPEIMDTETTNALLQRSGYPTVNLTTAELCEILKADAILNSNFSLSQPMADPAVHATITINDCRNQKLIWNYDHSFSATSGSSPFAIVDAIMRKVSRKISY